MDEDLKPKTKALKSELEELIANYEHNQKALKDCIAEFGASYPSACAERFDYRDIALEKVIQFWAEHRDRVAFMVWDGDESVPGPVISAWPTR